MVSSSSLLPRLLVLVVPAAACAPRSEPPAVEPGPATGAAAAAGSSRTGSPLASTGSPGPASSAAPGEPATGASSASEPGRRQVELPRPPLQPVGPVPVASSTAARPGEPPMTVCGPEYRSWPVGRTGGPIPTARCYQPAGAATCLGADAAALRSLLDGPPCVYDGPHRQSDPATGAPWCCYNVGSMGKGRPLEIASRPRWSGLRRGASWG
ncbi:MAG: hypothetical protein EOO75_03265 [Myxococcales bacterium]|nr:MAG: hypothetical protein EOO75_03265 [Myxococcales bacterium]